MPRSSQINSVAPFNMLAWRRNAKILQMKLEHLVERASRKPFRPFTINLNDGEAIPIDAPEAIYFPTRKPDLVITFAPNGAMHLFEHTVITSISE